MATPGPDALAAGNDAGLEGATTVDSDSPILALGAVLPARQLNLSFRAAGVVQAVNVQVGSTVRPGDVLALLDTSELIITLQSAQAAVEIRQAELDALLGSAQSSRSERAVAQGHLDQAQLEMARLQWRLAGATIDAPFSGVVADVFVHKGEWAETGAPVVDLIDTSGWLVETKNVSELDIGRVRIGQPAIVRVIPFGDQPITGEVLSISPIAVVQQGDTTYTLLIRLAQTDLALLPGMNAEVAIDTG